MSKLVLNTAKVASKLRRPSRMTPAFTLYGGRGSSNTDRVRLTLAEGGFTDYELVLLDLSKGEQKVRAGTLVLLSLRERNHEQVIQIQQMDG